MKNKFLILVIIFASVYNVNAQNFRGELLGGVIGSQVSGDQLSGYNKAGIMFGIGVNHKINDVSNLGFRIKFIQKGSRKQPDFENGDPTSYLMRLNYLEVPIYYRHVLAKKIYAEAGPSLAYLISNLERNEDGDLFQPLPFYTFDFSFGVAVGYPLTESLNFQFGYSRSILPVREPNSVNTFRLDRGQFNSLLSFEIVYILGKKSNKD